MSASRRVETLSRHLAESATLAASTDGAGARGASGGQLCDLSKPMTPKQESFAAFLHAMCEDQTADGFDYTAVLPGPMDDPAITALPDHISRVTRVVAESRKTQGKGMLYSKELAERYAGGMGRNYVSPTMLVKRGNQPYLTWIVNVHDPDDAERMARTHVKKSLLYDSTFLRDGVLSTRDNASWREQRTHLVEAFLPHASLAKIFPVSLERCKHAMGTILPEITGNFTKPVEIWEFWLNEAMAQLQLALLGESKETEAKTNKVLRKAFGDAINPDPSRPIGERLQLQSDANEFILDYSAKLVERSVDPVTGQSRVTGPSLDESTPVKGPLTAQIQTLASAVTSDLEHPVDRDTAATFLFAGHDTTANLMTWATFEMARQPRLQRRLQAEVDATFERLGGRDMGYEDLPGMAFLTRVITETLRLWPSVPNGTFRETEFDDVIKGRDGRPVTIPKGTNLQIGEWSLHMNPDLWGPDAEEFNPDRHFEPNELAGGMSGSNPQSRRYCPFTFMPRSCIGRNFAMFEARLLLAHFFRRFDVALAEPTRSRAADARNPSRHLGMNMGTMGPEGGMHVVVTPRRR